jgi:hypothetical protein
MGFMKREELQGGQDADAAGGVIGNGEAKRSSTADVKSAARSNMAGGKKTKTEELAAVDTRDHQQRKKEAREGPFNLTRSEAVEMVESFFSLVSCNI